MIQSKLIERDIYHIKTSEKRDLVSEPIRNSQFQIQQDIDIDKLLADVDLKIVHNSIYFANNTELNQTI